jgi:hypothetical protein
MRLVFITNVDCAKPFISRLNERGELDESNPLVGDKVTIFQNNYKVAEMQVVSRKWRTCNSTYRTNSEYTSQISTKTETELIVELNLTSFWSQAGYDKFEGHLKDC